MDGHEPVPSDLRTWAVFFDNIDNRRVDMTMVGDVSVSTVFLGMDHSFAPGPHVPILFETMTFGDDDNLERRYATWDEAQAGHDRIVAALREEPH